MKSKSSHGQFVNDERYKNAVSNLNKNIGLDFQRILEKVDEKDTLESSDWCSTVALCDLLAGKLGSEEKKRVQHHVRTCNRCKRLFKILQDRNPRAKAEFQLKILPRLKLPPRLKSLPGLVRSHFPARSRKHRVASPCEAGRPLQQK